MRIKILKIINYFTFTMHKETDEPAFIKLSGYKSYYKHGERHRDVGPARIFSDSFGLYYKNGERVDKPGENYYNK